MLARIKKAFDNFSSFEEVLINNKPDSPIANIVFRNAITMSEQADTVVRTQIAQTTIKFREKNDNVSKKVAALLRKAGITVQVQYDDSLICIDTDNFYQVIEALGCTYLSSARLQLFTQSHSLRARCIDFIEKDYSHPLSFWAKNKKEIDKLPEDIINSFSINQARNVL